MIRARAKTGRVQIAVLGEMEANQQYCLDACAQLVRGKVTVLKSFKALRKFQSLHSSDPVILVIALTNNIEAAVDALAHLRRTGLGWPTLLVVDTVRHAVFMPLMRELGVEYFLPLPLHGAELADALREALEKGVQPPPQNAPPLTDEEKETNIEEMAKKLNKCIRCGAGQNQVFLHSYVEDVGRKSKPRITLRCPLRTELHLEPYVYYEHVRDVCCRNIVTCAVLQTYAALKGQEISAYLLADACQDASGPAP